MKHLTLLIALLATGCATVAQPKAAPPPVQQAYSPCQPHTVCFIYKDTRVRTPINNVIPQSYSVEQRKIPKRMTIKR